MIVIGYPGIGKSTAAKQEDIMIDLESSVFNCTNNQTKLDDWYKYYCNIAIDLSNQNKIVFVSSHKAVIDYLIQTAKHDIMIVLPSLSLHDTWINKLYDRFLTDNSAKNYAAYKRAASMYFNDISYMIDVIKSNNIRYHCIVSENYNLAQIVYRNIEQKPIDSSIVDTMTYNKVCGNCAHFIGLGDFNLCCKLHSGLYYNCDKSCKDYQFKHDI